MNSCGPTVSLKHRRHSICLGEVFILSIPIQKQETGGFDVCGNPWIKGLSMITHMPYKKLQFDPDFVDISCENREDVTQMESIPERLVPIKNTSRDKSVKKTPQIQLRRRSMRLQLQKSSKIAQDPVRPSKKQPVKTTTVCQKRIQPKRRASEAAVGKYKETAVCKPKRRQTIYKVNPVSEPKQLKSILKAARSHSQPKKTVRFVDSLIFVNEC